MATRADLMPKALSRRKMLKRAAGLAVVGAAAGPVLSEAFATPAMAATTVETGAVAPAVVLLADAPTIAVDASLGNDFRVAIAANRTMGKPANPVPGQQIIFQVTQGGAGSNTLTWDGSYHFSASLPQPVLSTAPGQTDLLGFIYNAATQSWLFAAYVNGFT